MALDVAREFLKHGAGGAPAAGAGDDAGREGAQAHALQDLLRHFHLAGARFAGLRRERDADGVADAFLEQHGQRGGGGDDALDAHAGFSEAQMQGVGAATGQLAIDADQVLHATELAGDDDAIGGKAQFLGARRVVQCRGDECLVHDTARVPRLGPAGVVVHHARQQILIEAAPVHTDADRLVVAAGQLDHLRELAVTALALADIAGVDAVFVQRFRASRIAGQQLVAVEVEIADQGHVEAHAVQPFADPGHRGRRLDRVDRDAHQLRAGAMELRHLNGGGDLVGGVGVGHRLHGDGRAAADRHVANADGVRGMA